MRESAETFVGEHNFHAFTSQHGDLDLEIDHDQPTNQPLRKNVQIDMAGSLVMNFGKCTFWRLCHGRFKWKKHPTGSTTEFVFGFGRDSTRASRFPESFKLSGGRFTIYIYKIYKQIYGACGGTFYYHCSFCIDLAATRWVSRVFCQQLSPPKKIPSSDVFSEACNAMPHDGCWTSVSKKWGLHRQSSCASAFWGRVSCTVWSATSLLGSDSDIRCGPVLGWTDAYRKP